MDVASIREVLKEFAKQSEKMEMQQEMVRPVQSAHLTIDE